MTLYEIAGEYRTIMDRIEDADGEITDADSAALDAIDGGFSAKADSILALAAEAQAEADAAKEQEARFAKRKRSAQRRADWLKRYLKDAMVRVGFDRVKGDRFAATICRNGTPSIRWTRDPSDLPSWLRRVEVSLDGTAARAAFKDGSLPKYGFEVEYGTHLRVS